MITNAMTNEELIKIESDDPLVLELQERLRCFCDVAESLQQELDIWIDYDCWGYN